MAHTYSHLYSTPRPGCDSSRYMVHGAGRHGLFLFTKASSRTNRSSVQSWKDEKDFTYIDDIVTGVIKVLANRRQAIRNGAAKTLIHRDRSALQNLQHREQFPVELMEFIEAIEKALGKKAKKNFLAMQPGDVPHVGDVKDLVEDFVTSRGDVEEGSGNS